MGSLAAMSGAAVLGVLAPDTTLAAKSPVPVIEAESATGVSSTEATLNATINTNGLYTAYEFEIDTDGSYDYTQMACPLALPEYDQCMVVTVGPSPPVEEPRPEYISMGLGIQSVSINLTSIGTTLQPGTLYHYRVIAANTSNGPVVEGADQTFTTADSTSTPLSVAGDGSATGSTQSSAAIEPPKSRSVRSRKSARAHRHNMHKKHGVTQKRKYKRHKN